MFWDFWKKKVDKGSGVLSLEEEQVPTTWLAFLNFSSTGKTLKIHNLKEIYPVNNRTEQMDTLLSSLKIHMV